MGSEMCIRDRVKDAVAEVDPRKMLEAGDEADGPVKPPAGDATQAPRRPPSETRDTT